MFSDEPLFLAILDDPGDAVRRSVYADWLQERGDPRGDYLRLLLELRALPEGDSRIGELESHLRLLRPSLDRHWVAILHEFDARVHEVKTIRLRISTYGSAPKPYSGATKVLGRTSPYLLINLAGWQDAGRKSKGHAYDYLRRPPGARARNPIISVEVPTDAAIERLAASFRQSGQKSARMLLGPWEFEYEEASAVPGPNGSIRGPAALVIELGTTWGVRLAWDAGEEPPEWTRNERYVEP